MLRIAAIGLGNRLVTILKALVEQNPDVRLVALVDPDLDQVRERLKDRNIPDEYMTVYSSVDEMLQKADQYDGIMIGTRCNLHTPMAIKVARTSLPLFLEKPVAINEQQLKDLAQAFAGREDQVVVSFPLRATPLCQTAINIIQSGRLGTINQIQAFNDVTYGGVYFGQWHRNYDESGGLWLQKATHDFDYINALADAMPTMIAAMDSHQIYGGDKPHDLRCSQCDEAETCCESAINQLRRGDTGSMLQKRLGIPADDHACCFSRELKNQDAGSALIRYANGIHASYHQNFVVRREAGRRGARVVGHKATLEFNWHTEICRVVDHHGNVRVDEIKVQASTGHMGGDTGLIGNFLAVMQGKEKSKTDLHSGLLSAKMCLAAGESCRDNQFHTI